MHSPRPDRRAPGDLPPAENQRAAPAAVVLAGLDGSVPGNIVLAAPGPVIVPPNPSAPLQQFSIVRVQRERKRLRPQCESAVSGHARSE